MIVTFWRNNSDFLLIEQKYSIIAFDLLQISPFDKL